jgi:hypothetical protein
MMDRVAGKQGRRIYEVPVGFKFFVNGLLHGKLGFAGEESAGASFARMDGSVWTTDKDGLIAALLAAEITARCKKDPGVPMHSLPANSAIRSIAGPKRPQPVSKRQRSNTLHGRIFTQQILLARGRSPSQPRQPEMAIPLGASRSSPQTDGSRRGPLGRRPSTKFTQKASAAKSIWHSSRRKRRPSPTRRSRRRPLHTRT